MSFPTIMNNNKAPYCIAVKINCMFTYPNCVQVTKTSLIKNEVIVGMVSINLT